MSVHGSTTARYGETCLYEALVSGGTAPYTCKWGTVSGGRDFGADPTSPFWTVSFSNHIETVVVDVKDATGTVQRATLKVTVTSQGVSC